MTRITRMLATRLRRIASPSRLPHTARTAAAEAWGRLEASLTAPVVAPGDARRQEWVQEGTRLSITLIGQQGRGALARILAACDGDVHQSNEAVRIALSLAVSLGHRA